MWRSETNSLILLILIMNNFRASNKYSDIVNDAPIRTEYIRSTLTEF